MRTQSIQFCQGVHDLCYVLKASMYVTCNIPFTMLCKKIARMPQGFFIKKILYFCVCWKTILEHRMRLTTC